MRLRQYEGMFLFDPAFAADFAKAESEVRRILDRAEAELVFCRKWDERRLAYEIQGRRRGTYVLTYFKCGVDALPGIERDVRLSEHVLRVLVLKAEHMNQERMAEFAPERRTEAPPPSKDAGPSDHEKGPQTDEKREETCLVDSTATEPAPVPAPEAPVQVDKLGDLGGL